MRSMFVAFLLVAWFVAPAASQTPTYEYGEPEEMRGLTRLHVDAGTDVDLYRIMRKIIEKREPRLKVVPLEEAEFSIALFHHTARNSKGRLFFLGELDVITNGKNNLRLLSKYRHEEEELNDLADEIVKAFLKEYKRVNAGK